MGILTKIQDKITDYNKQREEQFEAYRKREQEQAAIEQKKMKDHLDFIMNELSNFKVVYSDKKNNPLLFIDEVNKKWYFDDKSEIIRNFSDLNDCELFEETSAITTTTGTSKTSGKNKKKVSLGKAVVGGVLLGPAGAIIGGTSGKTKVKQNTTTTSTSQEIEYCDSMYIQLTLQSFDSPIMKIDMINSRIQKNTSFYKENFENSQQLIAMFQNIINYK